MSFGYFLQMPFLVISPIEIPLDNFGAVRFPPFKAIKNLPTKSVNDELIAIRLHFLKSELLIFSPLIL